jgi:hypothetical protein
MYVIHAYMQGIIVGPPPVVLSVLWFMVQTKGPNPKVLLLL